MHSFTRLTRECLSPEDLEPHDRSRRTLVWSRARMMRENESDGDGGWSQPHEYVRPWAPHDEGRDEGADEGTHWPGANATPPPENGRQDTIAFGTPSSSSGPDGQGSYVQPGQGSQPGYGSQAGYEQAWYGSRTATGARPATGARTATANGVTARGTAEIPRATRPAAVTARPGGLGPISRRDARGAAGASWSISPSPGSRRASAPG